MSLFLALILIASAGVGGVAVGAMGYRYMLKRDPAKLEEWAQEIKNKTQG